MLMLEMMHATADLVYGEKAILGRRGNIDDSIDELYQSDAF